jgi:hypothetical protein
MYLITLALLGIGAMIEAPLAFLIVCAVFAIDHRLDLVEDNLSKR